jgi:hypothetical protein
MKIKNLKIGKLKNRKLKNEIINKKFKLNKLN